METFPSSKRHLRTKKDRERQQGEKKQDRIRKRGYMDCECKEQLFFIVADNEIRLTLQLIYPIACENREIEKIPGHGETFPVVAGADDVDDIAADGVDDIRPPEFSLWPPPLIILLKDWHPTALVRHDIKRGRTDRKTVTRRINSREKNRLRRDG